MSALFRSLCPYCGRANDQVAMPETEREDGDERPTDGDYSICFRCGCWGIFEASHAGGVRRPTKEEEREIASDPDCREVAKAWRRVRREIMRRH
jgi:hypothetical protein